jgi:hypothetical protein
MEVNPMNINRWNVVVVLCLAVLLLTACGSQQPAVENETAEEGYLPQAQEPTDPHSVDRLTEESTTGQLQAVDLVGKTVTIKDSEGNSQTFFFSESTEIIGAADAQGLTGRQGNPVIVRHTDREGRKMAVHIEIVGS